MKGGSAVMPTTDRIALIDAVRGFALLGILLVNMRVWSGWSGAMPNEHRLSLASPELISWYRFLYTALLEGKFYTIFAFLFGFGASLQLDRLGLRGLKVYRKRLWALLFIGVAHLFLVWAGDILALYALLGFALPLSRSLSDRNLLATAAGLILLPIAGVWIFLVAEIDPDLRFLELGRRVFVALGGNYEIAWQWRERSDWLSFVIWNLAGPWFRVGELLKDWRVASVLGAMLVGIWAGRRKTRLLEDRLYLCRLATWGIIIGLPACILLAATGGLVQSDANTRLLAVTAYALGVVPLGFAYAAGVALICTRNHMFLTLLAAPGRLALTNYLAQSVLGVAIFYGLGLGLINRVNPVQFTAIGAAIFTFQVGLSHLWLAHFQQGPIEYLWRRYAYA